MKRIIAVAINFAAIIICFITPAAGVNIHEDTGSPYNTWAGNSAGSATPTGRYNSFFGVGAGEFVTVGHDNSFFGAGAGQGTTTGYNNSFFGYNAGYANASAKYNTFFGFDAGHSTDYVDGSNTGDGNSFFGYDAGYSNTSGSYNVFIGFSAGFSNTTGRKSVFIGYEAGYSETASYRLYIDNCYVTNVNKCDMPLIYGEFDNRLVSINGALTMTAVSSSSDIRLKKNIEPLADSLNRVLRLKGISYEWKADEYPGRGFGKGRAIGLIAQDAETVIPEVVTIGKDGYKAISYDRILPVLVEAFKEQHKAAEAQKNAISGEDRLLDEQEKTILEQKSKLDENMKLLGDQKSEINKRKETLDDLAARIEQLEAEVHRLKGRDMSAKNLIDRRARQ